MARRRDTLDPEEEALWEAVLRTVRAYRKAARISSPQPAEDSVKAPATSVSSPSTPLAVTPQPIYSETHVDPNLSRRLRRGQVTIEGRLDLHGMTQAEAYAALSRFLNHSMATGKRCVLVITGRGRMRAGQNPESVGILKTQVPVWLQEPEFAPLILTISIARPEDGGQGAYYLLLRRNGAQKGKT